ncbi:uncharacterized protein PV09_04850 [Verruconis gallopava]|uniref:DUF4246 domain-containing protein n=1 Tax=Verruconis gallopava TaxID=253628 RepID=A0A0D1YTS3_9PEZI|nr:uncharacterized protein PV09_04850 [Verruconis gallopava]KIW04027.1 hypothetical protein PV09_04850 [Verruconis gallopava]
MKSFASFIMEMGSLIAQEIQGLSKDGDTAGSNNNGNQLKLPGFGLPIDFLPRWNRHDEEWERFPHGIADPMASDGVTVRERRMLEFVNQITDKPEWERKVFDDAIVEKWRAEACKYHEDIEDEFLSEEMFKHCLAELREKAERFKTTRTIAILDAEVTVVKSDVLVSASILDGLKRGVQPMENVPEHKKDWHPGSNEMVLDLVHPSMCPLIYGVSRVLPYGKVPLEECAKYSGAGEVVQTMPGQITHKVQLSAWNNPSELPVWGSFQWLPADIKFRDDGTAAITSYINGLHPAKHAELYPILEQLVDCAIPLWNETLSWFHNRIRLRIDGSSDDDYFIPEGVKYEGASDHSESSDFWWDDDDYRDWKEQNRVLKQREPEPFTPFQERIQKNPAGARPVDLRKKFATSGLQIIFKLANIQLTPEKPEYKNGSWHVEGALNEHICATALYYYDQENITDSYLSFRQSIDVEELTMKPAQSEYTSLEAYFGVEQEGPAIQELGKVLTREGRMLAFPNVLQHCVSSFKLKDETKPGHRKLLAMFLVDPHIPVLSTANVPPQQKDWWAQEVKKVAPFSSLPQEIFDNIIDMVEGFPLGYDEQCEIRDKLMGERGMMVDQLNDALAQETFFFCEH